MNESVALKEVADFDPPAPREILRADDPIVAFMPMAAVMAENSVASTKQVRQCSEALNGYSYFQDQDVLVAKITPCFENGKIALAQIAQEHGFGTTEFHVVRANTKKLFPKYLLHFLRQPWVRAEGERKMTGSAGQRRVPRHFLQNLHIPLPPMEEQRRIAAILDQAEALRAKRRQALAKLDTLTRSLFLEMFGDPTLNGSSWRVVELGELISDGPQNGLYRPASDYGEGTPILRIDAFYDGEIVDLRTLKRLRLPKNEIDRYALSQGDIVINRVNSLEYLGKSAIVPALQEPTVFESNMMRFRLDRRRVDPTFVITALQTQSIRGQILSRAKNAVNQSSINQGDVQSLRIPLPPIDLQVRFRQLSEVIKARFRSATFALQSTCSLSSSLQHLAFRGEL